MVHIQLNSAWSLSQSVQWKYDNVSCKATVRVKIKCKQFLMIHSTFCCHTLHGDSSPWFITMNWRVMWKYLVCILKVKVTIRTLKCTNLSEVENVSNIDGAVLLIRVSYGHTLVVCVIGVHEDLLQTQHTRNRSVEDAAILMFNYVSTMSMNTSRNQSLMSASWFRPSTLSSPSYSPESSCS